MATPGPDKKFFPLDEMHIWKPLVYQLARSRNTMGTIAGKFGCSHGTLKGRLDVMTIIREAWADHDEEIVGLLLAQARLKPEPDEDPSVQCLKLNLKAKAVAKLHDHIHTDIEQLKAASELKLNVLSDEDLKNRVRSLVSKLGD